MHNFEERSLSTCRQKISLWLCYVEDTFTALRHDEIDVFPHHLKGKNSDMQFTREFQEDGTLPFTDSRAWSRNENSLRKTIYKKLIHTDRLLGELHVVKINWRVMNTETSISPESILVYFFFRYYLFPEPNTKAMHFLVECYTILETLRKKFCSKNNCTIKIRINTKRVK